MTILNLNRDASGKVTYLRRPSVNMQSMVLLDGVAQSFTVPSASTRYSVIFSYSPGSDVWISINDTAVFPAGTIGSTNSSQNPTGYELLAGDVISLITDDADAYVGIELYAIQ